MRYFDFEKRMLNRPVFTSKELQTLFFDEPNILVQVAFWVKRGYLSRVEKGVYTFSKQKENLDGMIIAEKLYLPSYISLEFALNHHGIIPDVPFTVTSVTTRKTKTFKNGFGQFVYRHIKKDLFTGYTSALQDGTSVHIATPEKALFDYIYFNKTHLKATPTFWKEMRFDDETTFDVNALQQYGKIAHDTKVTALIKSISEYQYAR